QNPSAAADTPLDTPPPAEGKYPPALPSAPPRLRLPQRNPAPKHTSASVSAPPKAPAKPHPPFRNRPQANPSSSISPANYHNARPPPAPAIPPSGQTPRTQIPCNTPTLARSPNRSQ